MSENRSCPQCGCTEIGKGKLAGYANLTPVGKLFSLGSAVIADVCTDCGLLIRLRAENPSKFKSR